MRLWNRRMVGVLLFYFLAQASAGVIHVKPGGNDGNTGLSWDQAKQTVTAGLTAADSVTSNEVWVAAGTYNERITLKSGVALYGGFAGTEDERSQRDFAANVTILDGQQGGGVVTANNVDSASRIDGFAIRNGKASFSVGNGGGLYLSYSSPTIANCTISGNTASYEGGGLYLNYSSPTITHCTISGNSNSSTGGGLYIYRSSPTLAHCTIRGNSSTSSGGGLYLGSVSSPTITHCTISGNSGSNGGGLYVSSSSPTLTDCTISGNSVTASGGGLYLLSAASHPVLTNCVINENRASGAYSYGGGLYLSSCSATLTNCTISGNSTRYGGGLCLYSCSPAISNCTISGNIASGGTSAYGGGLYLCSSSNPTIANCTISGNNVSGTSGYGGGLYFSFSSPTVANCTISGNGASFGGGLCFSYSSATTANTVVAFNNAGIYKEPGSGTPVFRNNCVFGNSGYDYSGLTDPTGSSGNIQQDPKFVDNTTGNFHLMQDSPCIDAGRDGDVQSGWRDMDGEPRIGGSHVDMGADEYYFPGDANGDARVTFEDFCVLQNHYGQSGRNWSDGDFNGDGQVTFGDFAVLQNHYGQSMGAAADPLAPAATLTAGGCGFLGMAFAGLLLGSFYPLGFRHECGAGSSPSVREAGPPTHVGG